MSLKECIFDKTKKKRNCKEKIQYNIKKSHENEENEENQETKENEEKKRN